MGAPWLAPQTEKVKKCTTSREFCSSALSLVDARRARSRGVHREKGTLLVHKVRQFLYQSLILRPGSAPSGERYFNDPAPASSADYETPMTPMTVHGGVLEGRGPPVRRADPTTFCSTVCYRHIVHMLVDIYLQCCLLSCTDYETHGEALVRRGECRGRRGEFLHRLRRRSTSGRIEARKRRRALPTTTSSTMATFAHRTCTCIAACARRLS